MLCVRRAAPRVQLRPPRRRRPRRASAPAGGGALPLAPRAISVASDGDGGEAVYHPERSYHAVERRAPAIGFGTLPARPPPPPAEPPLTTPPTSRTASPPRATRRDLWRGAARRGSFDNEPYRVPPSPARSAAASTDLSDAATDIAPLACRRRRPAAHHRRPDPARPRRRRRGAVPRTAARAREARIDALLSGDFDALLDGRRPDDARRASDLRPRARRRDRHAADGANGTASAAPAGEVARRRPTWRRRRRPRQRAPLWSRLAGRETPKAKKKRRGGGGEGGGRGKGGGRGPHAPPDDRRPLQRPPRARRRLRDREARHGRRRRQGHRRGRRAVRRAVEARSARRQDRPRADGAADGAGAPCQTDGEPQGARGSRRCAAERAAPRRGGSDDRRQPLPVHFGQRRLPIPRDHPGRRAAARAAPPPPGGAARPAAAASYPDVSATRPSVRGRRIGASRRTSSASTRARSWTRRDRAYEWYAALQHLLPRAPDAVFGGLSGLQSGAMVKVGSAAGAGGGRRAACSRAPPPTAIGCCSKGMVALAATDRVAHVGVPAPRAAVGTSRGARSGGTPHASHSQTNCRRCCCCRRATSRRRRSARRRTGRSLLASTSPARAPPPRDVRLGRRVHARLRRHRASERRRRRLRPGGAPPPGDRRARPRGPTLVLHPNADAVLPRRVRRRHHRPRLRPHA